MVAKRGTLLISPHSDDICMSSAHIINSGFLPEHLHLVTVFSLSYHLAGSTQQPGNFMVPRIRMEEDITFCQAIGAAYHALGFYDGCLWNRSLKLKQRLINKLERHLLRLIQKLNCLAVICPYPNYNNDSQPHPHHEIVFKATTQAVARAAKTLLLFVDDQPYSRVSLDEKVVFNNTDYTPQVVNFSRMELDSKMDMMKIYKSQMKDAYFDAVRKPASSGNSHRYSETLWVPANTASEQKYGKKVI